MKRSKCGEVHMGAQQQQKNNRHLKVASKQNQNLGGSNVFAFPIQIKWKTVKMREQL